MLDCQESNMWENIKSAGTWVKDHAGQIAAVVVATAAVTAAVVYQDEIKDAICGGGNTPPAE